VLDRPVEVQIQEVVLDFPFSSGRQTRATLAAMILDNYSIGVSCQAGLTIVDKYAVST